MIPFIKQLFRLIPVFFLTACDKTEDDISGSEVIQGKIYIANEADGLAKKTISGQNVFIYKINGDQPPVRLWSDQSDSVGHFDFKNIYNRPYKIHAELAMSTTYDQGVVFNVDSITGPDNNLEIILKPDFVRQNGILFKCLDYTASPGPIPHATIYIYASPYLAALDADINGIGASDTLTTNENGTALKMLLNPIYDWHANAIITFSPGGTVLKSSMNRLEMQNAGYKEIPVIMHP